MADSKISERLSSLRQQAAAHAEMGAVLTAGTRLRGLKTALLRTSRVFASDQVRYNREVLEIVEIVESELERSRAAELELRELLAGVTRERDYDRSELRTLAARFAHVARTSSTAASDLAAAPARPGEVARGDYADFYREFEDQFRGSPDLVRSRQEEYLADFAALAGSEAMVVDIGCGRGEWLRLLGEKGIRAVGVDTNGTFIRMCLESGLKAELADAAVYLDRLDEASIAGVTAFHVAEHLDPSALMRLVDSAYRAMRPGGVLVLETPNPTNLTVGAANFWSDLTHLKPLFPQTLAFLVHQRGFIDVDLRFLHPTPTENFVVPESDDAAGRAMARVITQLNGWFFGPEDYAVVATKGRPRTQDPIEASTPP